MSGLMRHQAYERVQPLELVSGIINYVIASAFHASQ